MSARPQPGRWSMDAPAWSLRPGPILSRLAGRVRPLKSFLESSQQEIACSFSSTGTAPPPRIRGLLIISTNLLAVRTESG